MAARAAWDSSRTARAAPGRRAVTGTLPAVAARPAAVTASFCAGPAWPLHALTRNPGTAIASAAATSSGERPSRRLVTGAITRTSRRRAVRSGTGRGGLGGGRARAGVRDLAGGDGVLHAVDLDRRSDLGPRRRV